MATSRSASDETWGPLYRVGAISAGLAVVTYIVATVIFAFGAPLPETGGAASMLEYVDAHRAGYVLRQLLWLVPGLFLMLLFLALAVALRRHGRSLAAVAGLVGVSSWAVSFAWPTTGDGSLAMVLLSDRYAEAATAAERASFVAAAEALDALNDVPAALGVLQALGVLLISLLMLRGTFTRPVAWLGVAAGASGVVAEALRPFLGLGYAVYGLLLFVWIAWVGVELWRLAAAVEARARSAPVSGT